MSRIVPKDSSIILGKLPGTSIGHTELITVNVRSVTDFQIPSVAAKYMVRLLPLLLRGR